MNYPVDSVSLIMFSFCWARLLRSTTPLCWLVGWWLRSIANHLSMSVLTSSPDLLWVAMGGYGLSTLLSWMVPPLSMCVALGSPTNSASSAKHHHHLGVSINGGNPIAGWFISWKIPLKLMIWGYPDFRKPPFIWFLRCPLFYFLWNLFLDDSV